MAVNDRSWAGKVDPFDSEADSDEGYKPWRKSKTGLVRDMKFIPAKGSGEKKRFISLIQTISIELNDDDTELCMMCHTSGQIIFITGKGLDELAEMISDKHVRSVHVYHQSDGPMPKSVVTKVMFDKSISDTLVSG